MPVKPMQYQENTLNFSLPFSVQIPMTSPRLLFPHFRAINPNTSSFALSLRHSIFIFLAATGIAIAAPDWKTTLTPPGIGTHPRLDPIALDYQMSWKGILNSGHLRMEFAPPGEKKPGAYVVRAHAVSQGAAAALHPYQFDCWSELHLASLLPRYVKSTEIDSNGKEITIARYFENRVESETSSVSKKTGKPEVKNRTFEQGAVFDIFSSMLQIRSHPLADGDHINLVIQSSDQPYLLRIHCVGREMHNGQKAIKLSAGMNKIDRDTLELKPYKKLKRDATLWLSDDHDRVPIELRAEIFLGDVRATLTQRKKL